ncbi:hypothetical protein BGZ63DRAFT_414811 [Mariannaea sp. PMI_226]|nr:hypothetical protein BGZ63DRAFT_414811 [Mariannaea sp. PMI_226]
MNLDSGCLKEGVRVVKVVINPSSRNTLPWFLTFCSIISLYPYMHSLGPGHAARFATQGRSVLLPEARHRIGGRACTAEHGDKAFLYEMGGSWVNQNLGYVLKQLVRYNLQKNLVNSRRTRLDNDYYTLNVPGAPSQKLSHRDAAKMTQKARDFLLLASMEIYLDNIQVPRHLVEEIDKLSTKDPIDDIKPLLTLEELGILSALILLVTGGKLENSGLWDCICSHALLMIFDEAAEFGLQYASNTEIKSINDQTRNAFGSVTVTTSKNLTFEGRRVFCTFRLNVLKSVQFTPSISAKRQEAFDIGYINLMLKVQAVIGGSGLASWNGMCPPGHTVHGYGDPVIPKGETHIVAFGRRMRRMILCLNVRLEKAIAAFLALHPMKLNKTIFHNWVTDLYAQDGPAWWIPEMRQSPRGAVYFARGNWAHGWRA